MLCPDTSSAQSHPTVQKVACSSQVVHDHLVINNLQCSRSPAHSRPPCGNDPGRQRGRQEAACARATCTCLRASGLCACAATRPAHLHSIAFARLASTAQRCFLIAARQYRYVQGRSARGYWQVVSAHNQYYRKLSSETQHLCKMCKRPTCCIMRQC